MTDSVHEPDLKHTASDVDKSGMEYHLAKPTLAERARTERVIRRNKRRAYGFSTRHYHRNERLKNAAFTLLMMVAIIVGGVLFLV